MSLDNNNRQSMPLLVINNITGAHACAASTPHRCSCVCGIHTTPVLMHVRHPHHGTVHNRPSQLLHTLIKQSALQTQSFDTKISRRSSQPPKPSVTEVLLLQRYAVQRPLHQSSTSQTATVDCHTWMRHTHAARQPSMLARFRKRHASRPTAKAPRACSLCLNCRGTHTRTNTHTHPSIAWAP